MNARDEGVFLKGSVPLFDRRCQTRVIPRSMSVCEGKTSETVLRTACLFRC